MQKSLVSLLLGSLLFLSLNVQAVNVALVAPKIGDIPSNVRNAIQSDAVVSILENELVNIPNVTLAERIDDQQSQNEFQFEHTGMVSASQSNVSGQMAAAQYIILPKITYADEQDKTVHFTNFDDVKTQYQIELQIKVLNVTSNTLVYAKNFDATALLSGNSNDNWTRLLRQAADKFASDATFQQKIGATTPTKQPTTAAVLDTVKFDAASDATIFVNGDYLGVGSATAQYKDGLSLDVKVVRPGYYDWHYPVRVSKGLVVKAINQKIPVKKSDKKSDKGTTSAIAIMAVKN